jgi:hypothetical protein
MLSMSEKPTPLHFREYAGVMTAFLVVIAYVGIGFVQVAAVLTHGSSVELPGDWMAAMLSLASAALGFLIGKQSSHSEAGALLAAAAPLAAPLAASAFQEAITQALPTAPLQAPPRPAITDPRR